MTEQSKERAKEFARKYDRSLVAIATGIGVIVTTYLAMGNRINTLVAGTQVIQEIHTKLQIQDTRNESVKEDLMEIKRDIKKILMVMPRR